MKARLHCFGESGHSYKVALFLTLTGQDWEPVKVDFFGGANRSEGFRALNPMAECPVLEWQGEVLSQSGAILTRLARDTGQMGGASARESDEILRWILWDNHKFSSVIGSTRFLMNFLPGDKRPQEVIAFQQARLKSAYKLLNEHLERRDWVALDAPSIADLSLCSYLYYPEPFGFTRADWPHLSDWLDRIAALPGWKHPYELMPGSPADRAGGGNDV